MNIYVGNLPKTTNSDAVRKAFETFGEVSSVNLIKDKFTQELRGFGFVEMPAKKEGQDAIESLNGGEIDGRNIVVNEAKPRKDFSNNRSFNGRRW
jgi:RNA recognition motif-containing protein